MKEDIPPQDDTLLPYSIYRTIWGTMFASAFFVRALGIAVTVITIFTLFRNSSTTKPS